MSEAQGSDVTIIGGGPVGLFAVFQCGMLGLSCTLVDALPELGGQCSALYPEKPIYDIPGYPRIAAADLIQQLEAQAAPFAPRYLLGRRIENCRRAGDGFLLGTDKGDTIQTRAVIIAAGAGAFGPNRPPLAGIEAYEGKAVHYLVRRAEDFRGASVAIAGGGDSAVDWALALHGVAARIYMIHRRAQFRAAPESVARLKALEGNGVEFVVPYQLSGLEGDGSRLNAVLVQSLEGETRRLEAQHLLAFFGLKSDLGPLQHWGLDLERHQLRVDPATCATSEPDIHAIGDVASYPGKLKLILTGFAEAASAAHALYPRLKGKALHFEYSTTKGVPGQ